MLTKRRGLNEHAFKGRGAGLGTGAFIGNVGGNDEFGMAAGEFQVDFLAPSPAIN